MARNSITEMKSKPGVKLILQILAFLTVMAPAVAAFVNSLDETAEKKADLSYELLKQKLEFMEQVIRSNHTDIKSLRDFMVTSMSKRDEERTIEELTKRIDEVLSNPVDRRSGGGYSGTMSKRSIAEDLTIGVEDIPLGSVEKHEQMQQVVLPKNLNVAVKGE